MNSEIPNGNSIISGNFTQEEAKDLANILEAGSLPAPIIIVEETVVGPTLGAESIQNGLISIIVGFLVIIVFVVVTYNSAGWVADAAVVLNLFAICLMFLYILIRFKKWQFALGTMVSPVHTVLVVIAAFSLLEGVMPFAMEIDQSFIAAILTVIGYSINDSVVVFDRVREFLAGRKSDEDQPRIINNALNDTLSRTLITGMSTIFVIVILFFFGGETIKGFTFAMLIGTYSSLCIGTPVLVDFTFRAREKKVAVPA